MLITQKYVFSKKYQQMGEISVICTVCRIKLTSQFAPVNEIIVSLLRYSLQSLETPTAYGIQIHTQAHRV